jgi:hypothetical protein
VKGNFHARFLGGCGRVNRLHLPGGYRAMDNFPRTTKPSSGWPQLPEIISPSEIRFLGEQGVASKAASISVFSLARVRS